jgi:hypothetical protein
MFFDYYDEFLEDGCHVEINKLLHSYIDLLLNHLYFVVCTPRTSKDFVEYLFTNLHDLVSMLEPVVSKIKKYHNHTNQAFLFSFPSISNVYESTI